MYGKEEDHDGRPAERVEILGIWEVQVWGEEQGRQLSGGKSPPSVPRGLRYCPLLLPKEQ